jgi:hypothetical protein
VYFSGLWKMRRIELYELLDTDDTAIVWSKEKGLFRAEVICPECGLPMREARHNGGDGTAWRCSRTIGGQRHFKSVSIRDRSFFARSKLSVRACIFLLYEWSVGTTLQQAAFQLDINERTAIKHFKLFRELAAWAHGGVQMQRVGGEDSIVEIDECQLGRRKAHRGRMPNEIWVVGGLIRNSNPQQLFFDVVRKRDRRTLLPLIQSRVREGTHVVTDGWPAYEGLTQLGYRHSAVNHSESFVDPQDSQIHTQGIENVWGCLRRFLRLKGTYTRKNLRGYLAEFIFRKRHCDVFEAILSSIEERYERA